jgi:hypothetical protein
MQLEIDNFTVTVTSLNQSTEDQNISSHDSNLSQSKVSVKEISKRKKSINQKTVNERQFTHQHTEKCARCNRKLKAPEYYNGEAYGSYCVKKVQREEAIERSKDLDKKSDRSQKTQVSINQNDTMEQLSFDNLDQIQSSFCLTTLEKITSPKFKAQFDKRTDVYQKLFSGLTYNQLQDQILFFQNQFATKGTGLEQLLAVELLLQEIEINSPKQLQKTPSTHLLEVA